MVCNEFQHAKDYK